MKIAHTTIAILLLLGGLVPSAHAQEDAWWDSVGSGLTGEIRSIAWFQGELYASGLFATTGAGDTVNNVAKWDGTSWSGVGGGTNGKTYMLMEYDGDLYASGDFTMAGGSPVGYIARWDGANWQPLGAGLNSPAYSMKVWQGDLYVAGAFGFAGATTVERIAKWDGSTWSDVGGGLVGGDVARLEVYRDELIASGSFLTAGGISAPRVARWNGVNWDSLGAGANSTIRALAVVDTILYIGGHAPGIGGLNVNYVASWDGDSWSPMEPAMSNFVRTMANVGEQLFAGGLFSMAGGNTVNRISKWTGQKWIPMGSGANDSVLTLGTDSAGTLFVAGLFDSAGGKAISRIARWTAPRFYPSARTVSVSASDSIVVRNLGASTLAVDSVTSSSGLFAVTPASGSIPAGDSATFVISYDAADTTVQTASLVFFHDGVPGTDTIAATGHSFPVAEIDPADLDYGIVAGLDDFGGTVVVRNVGSFDLEISSVVADPAEFSVDPADATIAPGDSGVFTVTFSPETFGAHAGTLEIVHDGSSSPDTVTLAATVITSVSSSPASIAFGTVTGAGSLVDTVTLTNNDDDTISVASALSTDGSFSVSPGSAEIAPGERAQFLVTFAPVLAGGHTGQILFSHDGSPDGDTVDVSGTGVSALAVADLTPAEGNGGFANVPLTVTLTPPAPWGVTVILKTADGSAQAGADYTSDSTEIGFGPLDTTVVLNLQIFGDLISEADEDFVIQLSDVSGAVIIDTTALVTIQNDDAVIGTAAIISVADIPADQGGEVLVRWTRASNDSTGINPQTTSYGVWRKIPEGAAARASFRTVQSNDSLAGLYDFLGSVPATQTAVYAVPAPTLDDSTEAGSPVYTYIVTAHTSDSSLFTISAPDSGYSVDNLAPVAPAGLTAVKVPGPLVELAWDTPSETDIESHDIYRSDSDWFPLAPGLKIGAAGTNAFTDSFPLVGVAYYKIVARDIHGNVGPESEEVPVGLEASRTVEFRTGWSLVSVPLDVADFTADALFPDGITAAYAFAETGYVTAPELENGRGYWMKFPSAGDVSVDGNLIAVDTIAVHQGWNVIGSVSAPIAAASISSIPGGMITSVFYEYDGRYRVADTLRPGKGYWVKVASAGSLVLGSPENMQAAARIAIEPSRELPPPPPGPTSADGAGQADSGTAEAVPTAHALGQNYPNPFNPTTVIGYSLPEAGFVEIVVFDIAGQEVARPLSAHQEAGSRTVTFDASGLPSGVYTYQLRAGSFLESKKMLIMK